MLWSLPVIARFCHDIHLGVIANYISPLTWIRLVIAFYYYSISQFPWQLITIQHMTLQITLIQTTTTVLLLTLIFIILIPIRFLTLTITILAQITWMPIIKLLYEQPLLGEAGSQTDSGENKNQCGPSVGTCMVN